MLHHLAGAGYATLVADKKIEWAVLEDGDEIVSARTVCASSK